MLPRASIGRRLLALPDVLHVPLLVLAASAPFLPAAWQFVERGVPDYLFAGDGATLELRTLHAADGAQFLGPYSRFGWSHPGPLFFYLAVPVYEAFGERGPALNLFMMLINLAIAIAIVVSARRLRGTGFAWLVAALLAVFELIALPFVRTGEWNPVSPILPLLLLSFLTARVALGGVAVLPAFALIASAIVQTHIGYLPEVAALTAVAALACALRLWAPQHLTPLRLPSWVVVATVLVLLLGWGLPLFESATNNPGNMRLLVDFFSLPNPSPPPWDAVFTTLFAQLAALPVAVVRAFYSDLPTPGPLMSEAIAIAQLGVVCGIGQSAWRRRDASLGVLAGIALVETIAASAAVRGIRGDVLPYLVFWITVPGFMTMAAAAAWIAREGARWDVVCATCSAVLIGLALASPGAREPVFRERSEAVEQLALEIEQAVLGRRIDRPVVRIASGHVWPTAAGVIVRLRKRDIPFYVEPSWAFMFGKPLVDPGGERPRLLIGDRSLDEQARTDAELSPVAAVGEVVAYVEAPGVLARRRISPSPRVTAAVELDRDPNLAVDGVIPVDGTSWNSPPSAIFRSTMSSITIAVPRGERPVTGLFASVDGNDLYTVECVDRDLSWDLGVARPERGLDGMQVRRLFSDRIAGCDAVTIRPSAGDGLYSLAEIGFLR